MMAVRSVLLLLALTDAATGLFYKQLIQYKSKVSWTAAQTYCRNNYVDLLIIDTQSEFLNFTNQEVNFEDRWIGLRRNPGDASFTQWTDGTALTFHNWGNNQPHPNPQDDCVFTNNYKWENEQCTYTKKSYCYTWAPQMIVVQEMKNWEEALVHCRTFYTDLVSLTSGTDHFLVKNSSSKILTPAFWTGLRFMDGSWFWVNLKSPESWTLLPSLPSCPARPYLCGARNIKAGVWENRDCEEKMNFICYDIW